MKLCKWLLGTSMVKWLVLAILVGFAAWGSVAGYQNWQSARYDRWHEEYHRKMGSFVAVYRHTYYFRVFNGRWANDKAEVLIWEKTADVPEDLATYFRRFPWPEAECEIRLLWHDDLNARYTCIMGGESKPMRIEVSEAEINSLVEGPGSEAGQEKGE